MRSCIVLVLIFLYLAPQSLALDINRDGDRIIVSTKCSKLPDLLESLSRWKEELEGATETKNVCADLPFSGGSSVCSTDISNCLADHVKLRLGVSNQGAGPNCYNNVLHLSGIIGGNCTVHEDEFDFYLNSPLCRQLKNSEPRTAGVIGAIRKGDKERGFSSKHAFVWINDDFVFSKREFQPTPYMFYPLKQDLRRFGVNIDKPQCLENENVPDDCYTEVDYFECDSFGEYLEENDNTSEELKESFENLVMSSCSTMESVFFGSHESADNISESLMISLVAMETFIVENIEAFRSGSLDKESTFQLSAVKLRLQSLEASFRYRNEGQVAGRKKIREKIHFLRSLF